MILDFISAAPPDPVDFGALSLRTAELDGKAKEATEASERLRAEALALRTELAQERTWHAARRGAVGLQQGAPQGGGAG